MPATAKPIRLSIELIAPDPEIIKAYETIEDATKYFEECLKLGFVVRDRSTDNSRHRLTLYPMTRVRSFSIYGAE